MNFDKTDVREFQKTVELIADNRINNWGVPSYIAAIVSSVNAQGYVSVIIPPEMDRRITNLLNKTGEVLKAGDSVEIATKNGRLSNAWVAVKHGTNNSGTASRVANDIDISLLLNKIEQLEKEVIDLKNKRKESD